MSIAIVTASGQIGRAVVENLVNAGASVRLLCRHPEKVRHLLRRRVHAAEGSLDDPAYLVKATAGVRALFWVTPPCYDAEDLRAAQVALAKAAAMAIRANQIPQVVNLSSVGAHLGGGTGPIGGLHEVENVLDDAVQSITHLRPGYFFENYLWQLDSILHDGSVRLPVSGSARYPMIATGDIAQVAADRLLDPSWKGFCVRELHGPADLTFDQAAALISRAIGRRVRHVQLGPQQALEAMHAAGMSEDAAELMVELYQAIDSGHLRPAVPRSVETTTPTSLLEFARERIAPLAHEPVAPDAPSNGSRAGTGFQPVLQDAGNPRASHAVGH